MRRVVSLFLTIAMVLGLVCVPTLATQTSVGLALQLDGELTVGNTVEVALLCEENPGLGAVQFTLSYDRSVLKCTDSSAGPVLQKMLNVVNPAHKDGVVVVGASATAVSATDVLVWLTFEVLQAGDPGFELVDVAFRTETGEVLPCGFRVSGVERPVQPAGGSNGSDETEGEVPVQEPAFTDIDGHWAQDYLTIAKERDLVAGYPDGRCGPDDQVTRAQFVTILWKEAGRPAPEQSADFVDLEDGGYYLDAVAWAKEQGYVAGKGDNRFAPNDPVSREEMAVILHKLGGGKSGMELMFAGIYDAHFADSEQTSSWGKAAVHWALFNKVWCGKSSVEVGDELSATDPASRAEVAVMIINYQNNIKQQ